MRRCIPKLLVRTADSSSAEAPNVEGRGEHSEALGPGGRVSICRRPGDETLTSSVGRTW